MAKLIEADTRLDAWMQAADYLLEYSPMLNLTLAIESPTTGGSNDAIDKFLTDEGEFPMHTVAETIFPGVEYRRRGLRGAGFLSRKSLSGDHETPLDPLGHLRLSPGPAANCKREPHQSLEADDRKDAK